MSNSETLLARHEDWLARQVLAKATHSAMALTDADTADDIASSVAEACVRVDRGNPSLFDSGEFLAKYVERAVRNRVVNLRRDLSRRRRMLERFRDHLLGTDPQRSWMNPEAAYRERVLAAKLDAVFAALPRRQREVVECIYERELSYRQTAEELSISVHTVRNHYAAVMAAMRATVEP